MNKFFAVFFIASISFSATIAQALKEDTSWKTNYKAFPTKENDLVHTKLAASFNYAQSTMDGETWIVLHPHFYPTSNVTLDAKAMDIHQVGLIVNNKTIPLSYQYDSLQLFIQLDKTYKASENYTLYIKYTARPNAYKGKISASINDVKGLYFINPLGKDSSKPTQVWTQGETEGTSVWLPTIDKPNQKSTQEFLLTVPSKFVSLSNGLLVRQVDNKNGTRLDVWKMDLPHAPYLFFIGIGDYAIVKDNYKGKEVSYYIEKEYEKVARKIYGNTPAMLAFFEKITGVNYPWAKYAQMSARDFVTGAMENTTATLHSDKVQQDARELLDENAWETTIAHELFHQWFGDLVTPESWSNITVNESLADYSETLWTEYSKGKDAGAYENYMNQKYYLSSPTDAEKDLVRFYYDEKDDLFDLVSYQKGGRILNMLRHYVGEDAFFASLHSYLVDNQFSFGSAIKFKLAFEKVSGKDLNWFFNQWYYGNGHPYVRIQQKYLEDKKKVLVMIQQTQTANKLFTMPIGIDVYVAGIRNHYEVWAKNKVDSFYFDAASAPENVNVDNDKVLLWEKEDAKPFAQFAYQYDHARNLIDRLEAVNEAAENMKDAKAQMMLSKALKDSFYMIRNIAIHSYNPAAMTAEIETSIAQIASKDPSNKVKEEAIDALGALYKPTYKKDFIQWAKDSSYIVSGAALEALEKIDSTEAKNIALLVSKHPIKKRLKKSVVFVLAKYGDDSTFDFVASKIKVLNNESAEKFYLMIPFSQLMTKVNDPIKFKEGIDLIVAAREAIPQEYRNETDYFFNAKVLGDILKSKKMKGQRNLVDIVSEQIPR
ncbi:MAG: M1 family metallopeptidase [Bacteroidetes bacterium]|nr:M1 family metallopeptidase [Bacteroidota bacterium]